MAFTKWGTQQFKTGDVISDSKTGVLGDYNVEYWKNGGTGTMSTEPAITATPDDKRSERIGLQR